jgi:hypothetical protein
MSPMSGLPPPCLCSSSFGDSATSSGRLSRTFDTFLSYGRMDRLSSSADWFAWMLMKCGDRDQNRAHYNSRARVAPETIRGTAGCSS